MTYNGYYVGGGGYSWRATNEMQVQGYSSAASIHYKTISNAFEVWDNDVSFNFFGTDLLDQSFVHFGYRFVYGATATSARVAFNDPDGDGRLGYEHRENAGDGSAAIYLDLNRSDYTDLDKIYEVLLHAVGHVVGLSDSSDPNSIMNSRLDGDPTLSATDKANLIALYDNPPPNIDSPATGTPVPAVLFGTAGSDRLLGAGTEDTLSGLDGNDEIWGYAGTDYIHGGNGNDIIYGNTEIDSIQGGNGNDVIYGGQNSGVPRADDSGVSRQIDGVETISGGAGEDVIYGNFGGDRIVGGSGKDTLFGGQGDDTLSGGSGDDQLFGNRGNDFMDGGAGADIFHVTTATGYDRVLGFEVGIDRIQVRDGSSITISENAGNAVINIGSGGGRIELMGTSPASLNGADFLA